MVNTTLQNTENTKDVAIDALLAGASKKYKSIKSADGSFSNIINNLNAKSQKTQSNFVDKAVKTNTSSINKKAFDSNNTSDSVQTKTKSADDNKNIKDTKNKNVNNSTEKTTKKEINEKPKQNNTEKNKNTSTATVKEEAPKTDNTEAAQKTQNENTETISKDKDNQSQIPKLSDINDNSSVEPSPAFLEENSEIEISKEEIDNEAILDIISTATALNTEQIQPNNKEVLIDKSNDEISNQEDSEIKIEAPEESSEYTSFENNKEENNLLEVEDNSKEIKTADINSDENKDIFKTTYDKTIIEDSEKTETNELSADNKDKKENTINIKEEFSFGKDEEVISNADYSDEFQKPELKTETQQEVKQEEAKNTKIAYDYIKKDEAKTEVNNYKEIQPEEDTKNDSETIQIKYDDEINQDNTLEIYDDEKAEQSNEQPILKTAKKDDKTIKDSENTKKIVDLIKENNSIDEEEEKIAYVNNEQIEAKAEEVKSTENTKTEIKTEIKNTEIVNNNTDNAQKETNNQKEDNTGKEKPYSKEINTNDKEQKTFKAEIEIDDDFETNEEIPDDIEIIDKNTEDKKLFAKIEKNSNTAKVESTEENLEKIAFKQEKLEEIIVSVSKTSQDTSALTVMDEVAKIAINENTSINSPANIVYDSAGENIVLKNMQIAKPQENIFSQLQSKLEQNNIMNQIVDKFQQLRDAASQKLTMVLRPHDLGRLSIELQNGIKGLSTNIVVQNEDVKSYIEKNINSLRNSLASAGVNVNSIQIKTAGGESSTYSGNQEQNANQEEAFREQDNKQEKERQNNNPQENLFASLSNNFDMSFANDFSSVLSKTISYVN